MANIFVATTGNDSTGDGSSGNPYLTVGKAFSVMAAGDVIRVKVGTYTITSALALPLSGTGTAGPCTLTSDDPANQATITCATNSVNLISLAGKSFWQFLDFKLTHTAGTRGAGLIALTNAPQQMYFRGLTVDGCSNGFQMGNLTVEFQSADCTIAECEVKNCTNDGIQIVGTDSAVERCYVHGNARDGVRMGDLGVIASLAVRGSIITANGGVGVNVASNRTCSLSVERNTISGNTGDGIASAVTTANTFGLALANNIIDSNGGWGVNLQNSTGVITAVNRNNAYRNNTSGARSNLSAGTGDVTLTADPFTNKAGGDYSLNSVAGGGAACRAAGFPGAFPGGTTTGYLDVGAVQHQDAGGGGSTGGFVIGG